MPKGAAVLARKSGAPVLPGFVLKENGEDHYLCFVGGQIPVSKGQDKKRDIELNTQRITKVIEDHIKMHPENWYMFQPIWKEER